MNRIITKNTILVTVDWLIKVIRGNTCYVNALLQYLSTWSNFDPISLLAQTNCCSLLQPLKKLDHYSKHGIEELWKRKRRVIGKQVLVISGVVHIDAHCLSAWIFITCILASVFKGTSHHWWPFWNSSEVTLQVKLTKTIVSNYYWHQFFGKGDAQS